jgi:tRNA A58 N-methylase Trm61
MAFLRTFRRSSALAGVITCGVVAVVSATAWALVDDSPDETRLAKALDVKPGMTIAEIGAGDGELTLAIARRVTEAGRLYTSELGADRIKTLRAAVDRSKLTQITVIEADAAKTNLPAECCDAIFMRAVYHHFADPPAMNRSLKDSLKPGGLLAVLDFTPPTAKSAKPAERGKDGQHGVTRETLTEELTQAGFELVRSEGLSGRNVMVVVRKPL